jgi:hypothetical protein
METAMKKQAELSYCKARMVNVNLRQGLIKCIEENQCFSDDPCPLDAKFHPAPAAPKDGNAPVTATANFA